MLNKGNLHGDGRALGFYLLNPGEGEEVWLHSTRGFMTDIEALPTLAEQRQALMDELGVIDSIAADATRAEKAFFHAYCRVPLSEDLTLDQWQEVAARIEARLALSEQPRAIAFHVQDGIKHMHMAFSRIDMDTMKAIDMPYFIERMMNVSRELERAWGLRVLDQDRDPDRPRAAKRDEFEEARRLGVSIADTRQFIRDCSEHADNGHAYMNALDDGRMILARGDRRPYIVVDYQGGMHSLDKSVLGITIPNIKKWLSDLDYERLPTVAEAREMQALRREREDGRTRGDDARTQEPTPARERYEILREEHARAIAANRVTPEDYFDRDAAARSWDAGLVDAAIAYAGKPTPAELAKAREATLPEHPASQLSRGAGEIRLAFSLTEDEAGLRQALADRGYTFARVTAQDIAERDRLALAALYRSKDAWMLQEGGAAALSDEYRGSAERSFAAWQEKQHEKSPDAAPAVMRKQRAPFSFPQYVSYVQDKWADEIEKFGGREKLDTLNAVEADRSFVPKHVDAGDLVAVSRHGYGYRLDRHSTGLNQDHFRERLARLDRAALPTFHEATTRAFMDKAVSRMEKGRSWQLKQADYRTQVADQVTDRDPGYASYRSDKLAAQHAQQDLAKARYDQEALRAVAARHLAMAQDQDEILLCSPRYKFKLDALLQEKARALLGEQVAQLPSIKDAKRAAWVAERKFMVQRDVTGAFREAVAVQDQGQGFIDRLSTRGYAVERDQRDTLYLRDGNRRTALSRLLNDQQRALLPKISDVEVYSRLMQFDNPHPERTPEEKAEYARHEARAQVVMERLAQPSLSGSALGETLGTQAVAIGRDTATDKTYAVTERFRFELKPEQTERLLRVMNAENARTGESAPALTPAQLPDLKQAHGIAYALHRDNEMKRNVNEALDATRAGNGGGQEFAERLAAKDFELVRDYGNRLYVDTGKRKLSLHDLAPADEPAPQLKFEPAQFKALPQFRSGIDVLEAQSLKLDKIAAERRQREAAYVVGRALDAPAQAVSRTLFAADRAATVAYMGVSFVGRGLGMIAGGITSLFADFGKWGQRQSSVARRGILDYEPEPMPGRMVRDTLSRHSGVEIAANVGLLSQAASNSGMIGDDKRLEIERQRRGGPHR